MERLYPPSVYTKGEGCRFNLTELTISHSNHDFHNKNPMYLELYVDMFDTWKGSVYSRLGRVVSSFSNIHRVANAAIAPPMEWPVNTTVFPFSYSMLACNNNHNYQIIFIQSAVVCSTTILVEEYAVCLSSCALVRLLVKKQTTKKKCIIINPYQGLIQW